MQRIFSHVADYMDGLITATGRCRICRTHTHTSIYIYIYLCIYMYRGVDKSSNFADLEIVACCLSLVCSSFTFGQLVV